MRKVMIGVMLASMSGAGLAADGNWPFVAVRSYGTLKANARFTERLLAAQRRHPGLVDEVWPGCPARRAAIGTNKFARLVEDLPYLARCRELGIAVGWQYSTVGHGCDGRYGDFADSDWIVNSKGELKPGILCMTSPAARAEFRSFAEAVLRIVAPDSLWPDDDLRLQKAYTAGALVCFCDRCLALFKAESGYALPRKELAERLFGTKDDSEETSRLRKAWADFNEHVVAGMAAVHREAIEKVRPGTRLGIQICDAWSRYEGAEHPTPILKALAGNPRRPIALRPGGGFWADRGDPFGKIMWNVLPDAVRAVTNSFVAQVCYEAENWPHIASLKTPGAQMLECSLMLAAGCNALSLYYGADQNDELPEDYDFYFDTLARWKPFLLAVRDAFAGTGVAGIAQFVGSHYGPGWCWDNPGIEPSIRLLENSVPVTVLGGGVEAHWLDRRTVGTLAERDLHAAFSRPVVMDCDAFLALGERFPSLAFAKRLSVERFGAFDWGSGVKTGYEEFADGKTAADVAYVIRTAGPGARLLSRLSTDTTGKLGCMAEVETEFGGKVVVMQSFELGGARRNPWTFYRRKAILDALDAAIPGGMHARLLSPGSVQVFARVDRQGRTAGVYLLNWWHGETFPVKLAIRRPAKSAWRVSAPMGDVAASVQPGRDGELIVSMPSLQPSSAFLIH